MIMPDGSRGHRRASSYPALPILMYLISGRWNFSKRASIATPVNCSNQTGVVLNILVKLADSLSSP